MLDRSFIGHALAAFTVTAEHRGLRAFARATLPPGAVFSDRDAALASGLRDCALPPTYLFCLEMERPDPGAMQRVLDIDVARVLPPSICPHPTPIDLCVTRHDTSH